MKKVLNDEFENVTGIVYLYQLLINLYNLETSLKMSIKKCTWNSTPYPWFAVHVLNWCKVRALLFLNISLTQNILGDSK